MLPLPLCILFASGAVKSAHIPSPHALLPHSSSSSLPAAPFFAPITSRSPRRASKSSALHALRSSGASAHTAPLMGSDYDYEYLANITIGGQGFSVIVDTGRCVLFP